MDSTRQRIAAQVLRRYQSGQMSRREALRLLSALSLTTAGVGAIGLAAMTTRSTSAGSVAQVGVHAGHGSQYAALLRQDAGTPAAVATPTLGEQADGTHVWRVRVAGMDEENLIDTQAFFPKEITINVGDAIYFEFPTPPGFHTVTFPSGEDVPPLIIPDEATGTPPASPSPGAPKLIVKRPHSPRGRTRMMAPGSSTQGSISSVSPAILPSSSPSPHPERSSTNASRTAP